MTPSNEQRLARIEALFEMDATSSQRLEKRLDKIDDSIIEVRAEVAEFASDMKSAKLVGRAAIGAALMIGGAIASVFHIVIDWKKSG